MKSSELNERGLAKKDLTGEPRKLPRLEKFINKVVQGEPFQTEIPDDPEVIIKKDPELIQSLKNQLIPPKLPKEPEGTVPLSKIKKTAEFGGEEQGKRLEKETKQRENIDVSIKERLNGQPYILLKVGDRTIEAAGAKPSKSGVKSDVSIIDDKGKEVAWISLKDGSRPQDFGHWGGTTHEPVSSHEEIAKFVKDIKNLVSGPMLEKVTLGRFIKDEELKNWGVFGKEFGKAPSQSNVDLIIQGQPAINETSDGVFEITGTHSWANGVTPDGGYEPVLIVRYTGDRPSFGIKNARVSIYPKSGRRWYNIDQPEDMEYFNKIKNLDPMQRQKASDKWYGRDRQKRTDGEIPTTLQPDTREKR